MNFYQKLLDTAENIGLVVLSDELCCQILAFTYAFGNNEKIVLDGVIRSEIEYAQKKLNLYGGEVPDGKLYEMLRGYLKEVDKYNIDVANAQKSKYFRKAKQYTKHPDWVLAIFARWKLKPIEL